MIRSNPDITRFRQKKLQEYVRSELISSTGEFICTDHHECRTSRSRLHFHAGQMSHLGQHYDLEVDGSPMRIVFLGQEYGKARVCVDLEERYQWLIDDYAQWDFKDRSKHMRGVTSTLRLLLGREPGLDKEGERLMRGVHIFDGFALVNYLLCSALEAPRDGARVGGGKCRSNMTMRRNCARHLKATLDILDPTVIVIHGRAVHNWMVRNGLMDPDDNLGAIRINGKLSDVLTFDHPSAGGKSGYWGQSTNSSYLRENVAPQIKAHLRKQGMHVASSS